MKDKFSRTIDYLRISVTDKCNLRCVYCMPEEGIEHMPHEKILTFEEILKICEAGARIGIRKIKITGGEPLIRPDIVNLIKMVKLVPGIEQVTLTTNGVLLAGMIKELKAAGIDGINISLDTLDCADFYDITRRDQFKEVFEGLKACVKENIRTKINCVPVREFNDQFLLKIAALAKEYPVDIRFIELMPIGCGKGFHPVSNEEIKKRIEQDYGSLKISDKVRGNGPALYYEAEGFIGGIGFISPITHEFCEACNRIRLTSDGMLKLCLHYECGVDLKTLLRSGINDEKLSEVMATAISQKPVSHDFNKHSTQQTEQRNMSQIGG